jgi:hypothetical protein
MATLRRYSLIFRRWQCMVYMCACIYVYAPELFLCLSLLSDNLGSLHISYSVKTYELPR